MTSNTELLYWRENDDWFIPGDTLEAFRIRDDAPDRAKQSFKMWQEHLAESNKRHAHRSN